MWLLSWSSSPLPWSSSLDVDSELDVELLFSAVLSSSKDKDPKSSKRAPSSNRGEGGVDLLFLVELCCNGVSKGKPEDLPPCIGSNQLGKEISEPGLGRAQDSNQNTKQKRN